MSEPGFDSNLHSTRERGGEEKAWNDAIVGQEEGVARLSGLLTSGRLPHALLFSGPTGVGKATTARALVAALFCTRLGDASNHPGSGCGHCRPCLKIAGEQHPDWVQITLQPDKTRIAVEQIRDLRAFLTLTPLEARLKVALIDDAALMNEAAANALLKTLEEPPPASSLILCTSRPGILPPTIRSRCQQIRFFPLRPEALRQVAQRKFPDLDADTLSTAVELAAGSVGLLHRLCGGDLREWHAHFLADMERLPHARLADLSTLAAYWSDRERFAFVQTFLMAWFQATIRSRLSRWQPGGAESRILDLARQSRETLAQVETFNLNRQMALETVFIHLGRWLGASM
ncbi:MAG: DNA polymerase III subunit delta' [Magnetococcales bacterium]|nr:DNA polymerase III subunit delta' [Magnetococcales bacterium]